MNMHGLDFIGIQETQLESFRESWLDQLCARQNFFWHVAASTGKSEGILVGVRTDKYNVTEVEQGFHFVKLLIIDKITNFKWNLVVIYGADQMVGRSFPAIVLHVMPKM
jgi:hypothetical protein